jgi:hypothetical protein
MNLNLPNLPRAACRNADPEIFFPAWDTHRPTKRERQQALAEANGFCGICPERLKCLRWALDNDAQGIWGGTTDDQRRAIQKKPLTQEQRRRRVRQLHREGLNDGEIADRLDGVSRSVVQNDRRVLGLPENYYDNQAIRDRRTQVAELHGQGLNDREIAARIGTTRDTVHRDRTLLGLPKNYNPARQEATA